jgi:hypothetical protein
MRGGKRTRGEAKLAATENEQPDINISMVWTRERIAYNL